MEIAKEFVDALSHGHEETYLEYKGDVSWNDNVKRLEIVKSIFALANRTQGGIIAVGVNNAGVVVGVSEENFASYSHDAINQYLHRKTNQPISCKVTKYENYATEQGGMKKIVIFQIDESSEFPTVYIGDTVYFSEQGGVHENNVALRKGALYIRTTTSIGNKEIETIDEWKELIERTYRKYERETIRRSNVISDKNPFDEELAV